MLILVILLNARKTAGSGGCEGKRTEHALYAILVEYLSLDSDCAIHSVVDR